MEDDVEAQITSLFEEYADGIYRLAAFSLPRHIDPQDVVQEVFMKAFRSWKTFRKEASARNWLYRIARNHINDMLRKNIIEKNKERYLWADSSQTIGLESLVEYEELLMKLPVKHRQVLVLRAMDGFEMTDIAEILRCNEATVRVRWYRAKKRMMELLQKSHAFESSISNGGTAHVTRTR